MLWVNEIKMLYESAKYAKTNQVYKVPGFLSGNPQDC